MSKDEIASLKVNQERMMKTLHDTCAWGTGKRWGRWAGLEMSSLPDLINKDGSNH